MKTIWFESNEFDILSLGAKEDRRREEAMDSYPDGKHIYLVKTLVDLME